MPSEKSERNQHIRSLSRYHRKMADRYESAAATTQLEEYSQLFREHGRQHADFADELEEHATTLEGSEEEIEEVELPQLYQELGRFEDHVSESDLDAMIAETKRIEDELLEQYEDAMEAEASPDLRDRISDQFAQLQQSRRQLRPR